MARYASGKYALGTSDRSGRAYKLTDMVLEWNKLLVGRDEYEAKQPQLSPRRVKADPQALRISRPDRTEPAVTVLLPFNPFKSGSGGSAVITVTQPGHGRSTGDTVRFRSVEAFDGFTAAAIEADAGFSITKVDDDRYTFTSGSGTATSGNVLGGGGTASAGPVTVSA
tara:strand:+ start:1938 stop:2441 length:504 start_codon:yes stop_codon:yes gene_type:complete